MFLRNVGSYKSRTVSHSRRQNSSPVTVHSITELLTSDFKIQWNRNISFPDKSFSFIHLSFFRTPDEKDKSMFHCTHSRMCYRLNVTTTEAGIPKRALLIPHGPKYSFYYLLVWSCECLYNASQTERVFEFLKYLSIFWKYVFSNKYQFFTHYY
jgi:hypothetical protein